MATPQGDKWFSSYHALPCSHIHLIWKKKKIRVWYIFDTVLYSTSLTLFSNQLSIQIYWARARQNPTKWSVRPAKTRSSLAIHPVWSESSLCAQWVSKDLRLLLVGWLCWGLTSQSTIFQSCRDGAIASWVINQYSRGVKCLAQGHNTAAVGLEPRTSRSGVRHSTTEPPRSPLLLVDSEDWSDWADVQADLSFCWTNSWKCWFCHALALMQNSSPSCKTHFKQVNNETFLKVLLWWVMEFSLGHF